MNDQSAQVSPPPKKRRWLRYTLLALVIGIVSLYFVFIFPNRNNLQSINNIQKAGGIIIKLKYTGPEWLETRLSHDLKIKLNLINVESVRFIKKKLSSSDIETLYDLENLRNLYIYNTVLESGALERIGKLSKLEELALIGTNIKDPDLFYIGELTKLKN